MIKWTPAISGKSKPWGQRERHRSGQNKVFQTNLLMFTSEWTPVFFGQVPFGDTKHVKEWLQIVGQVNKPEKEHPKRPIHGLDCERGEVSGSRLWGFIKEQSKSPDKFFHSCFIHNYCPLVFMSSSGKNITPPQLPKQERQQLLEICDNSLAEFVKLSGVKIVVGVGKFAEERAHKALKDFDVEIYSIMHPSPASPAANACWSDIALKQLTDVGLTSYIRNEKL